MTCHDLDTLSGLVTNMCLEGRDLVALGSLVTSMGLDIGPWLHLVVLHNVYV
jgi:hypothetical protein